MFTFLTTSPQKAAEYIKKGGVVAFPTETVYGLGANVFDEKAVAKIFRAKRRPNDNPLIAHVGNINQIRSLAKEITPPAEKFIEAFFPAALTLVLPKSAKVPLTATAGLETIGVRMPRHERAREFLKYCETPVVAPSANLSGKPSPTKWEAVYEDLNGRIDCILQGEATEIGLESTVVDCTGETPLILRSGAVTLEELQKIVPATRLYELKENEAAKSPGLKHKHYAPKAKVFLIPDSEFQIPDFKFQISERKAFIGLNRPAAEFELTKICASVAEYAHEVFAFFRECDAREIAAIYCESVPKKGIGLALMDRLKRAAE